MSLLSERAVRHFDVDESRRLDAGDEPLADAPASSGDGDKSASPGASDDASGSATDFEELGRLVGNRPRLLAHPTDEDRLVVPLHEPDSAELSGEYVDYEDHPLRGRILVFGDDEAVPLADLGGTALGRRLRFWLPGVQPDSLPSYVDGGPTDRVTPHRRVGDDPEAFLDRIGERVDEERAATRERNRERARHRSPEQLAADGVDAVPRVEGVERTDEDTVRVHAVPPDGNVGGDVRDRFGIFEDDEVLIHSSESRAPDAFPVPATVTRFARLTLDLTVHEDVNDRAGVLSYLADAPADALGLSMLLNPVSYDRRRDAVGAVRQDRDRLDLVTGRRDATFANDAGPGTRPRDERLDPSQSFAATCACYADDVCCVHGPPGTGKTRVLVEVVRRAVAHGERVLVCADSNQAVDNLLVGASTSDEADEHSLHAHVESGELSATRHRAGNSDSDLVRDAYGGGDPAADVVAATDSGAAEFDVDAFDLAVVDEATQATVSSAFVPFTRAERAVLAGDHKQLPPFEAGVDVSPDRHHSLFEHLYADDGVFGSAIGVRLDTQYRMHPAIAEFSGEHFYDGDLHSGADVEPIDGLPPLVGVDVAGEEGVDETSHYNEAEADCVASVVDQLLGRGVDPAEIGVITPYDAQVGRIRSALGPNADAVEVDTVDSFQGSEREAVVVSFVRSNDDGDVGFLARPGDGPRRLNVALTRAERFCALVGDWSTLRASHRDEGATRLYADLHEHLADRNVLVDGADAIGGVADAGQ